MGARHRTQRRIGGLVQRCTGQIQSNHFKNGGTFSQDLNQLNAEHVPRIAQYQSHDQLAEYGGLTKPARTETSQDGEKQYAGYPEDDGRDGIGMGTVNRRRGEHRRDGDQEQHQTCA